MLRQKVVRMVSRAYRVPIRTITGTEGSTQRDLKISSPEHGSEETATNSIKITSSALGCGG